MFGSMSPSSMFGDSSLKYYCMSCGTQHKQVHVLNVVLSKKSWVLTCHRELDTMQIKISGEKLPELILKLFLL